MAVTRALTAPPRASIVGAICAGAFVATVWAANYAVSTYGLVPAGFGLVAPAGVYLAGLALTLRDVVHHLLGRSTVLAAILVGAAMSYGLGGNLALASGVAFLVSESLDLAVYEPLRRRGMVRAVLASNVVGGLVDSALFLFIAFGSLEFLTGQLVGKGWMTLAALPVLALTRSLLRRELA